MSLSRVQSTSGTTGDPKLVRLSRTNIDSNARSIAAYLGLDTHERAITTLHFYYSYWGGFCDGIKKPRPSRMRQPGQ